MKTSLKKLETSLFKAGKSMKIKADDLINAIHDLIFQWQKQGIAIDTRTHKISTHKGQQEISWGRENYSFSENIFCSLSEYCSLIENKQYSMLLWDGSFFQFSFCLHKNKIIKHRLCWYPAPVKINEDEILNFDITSIILEKMKNCNHEDFLSKSPIRFDYAPTDQTADHPSSHVHLNTDYCRIPVKSPLSLDKFMGFIVNNFYPNEIRLPELLRAKSWATPETITNDEKRTFHFNILS